MNSLQDIADVHFPADPNARSAKLMAFRARQEILTRRLRAGERLQRLAERKAIRALQPASSS